MNLGMVYGSAVNVASKLFEVLTVRPSMGFMVAMAFWLLRDDGRLLQREFNYCTRIVVVLVLPVPISRHR